MKKDHFTTPIVLKFEKAMTLYAYTAFHCDSRKLFILFLPQYEWTNTLKLVGEKANTKSNQAGMELFGSRDWIKSQSSTTALANKDT